MRRLALAASACCLLVACEGAQSALRPQGPHADQVATLWWAMCAGAAVILAAVTALALYAVLARRRPRRLGGEGLVISAGAALPVVVLTALLVWILLGTTALTRPPGPEALRIAVTGKMWWWEVRYLDSDGEVEFVTANELHVPVGRPVLLELDSSDVIHSFWVPALAGKIDLIPGHVNRWRIEASRPGQFRGQCAEFCGLQHAKMAFWVVAHEPPDFDAWLAKERGPSREADAPLLKRGREVFLASGCGACHAVRGTPAQGRIGPDLTHVGGRLSIAAGTFEAHAEALADWIANADRLKPGVHMPSFDVLDEASLQALAAWLESLE